MNKESKILVTGGTGLIGSYLLRKLVASGYQNIFGLKRSTSPLHLLEGVYDKVRWFDADVRDSVSMHDHFIGVDTVIHCAGMISFWPKEFREMYDVNVIGTANVVNLSLEHGVNQFIHLSSIEALGKNEDDSPIDERTEYKEEMQHTKYANTKYLGELEAWRGQAEGLNTVIYNPALVLGAYYWDHGPMSMIKEIYQGLNYYPQGSIAMIDVRDLVDVIVSNLDNKSLQGERIILGSYNQKFKKIFDSIAANLEVSKPTKALKDNLAQLVIFFEKIKSLFSGSKPLINKETYLVANQQLSYSFDKINQKASFNPIPFEKTIADICSSFLESHSNGNNFGVLTWD